MTDREKLIGIVKSSLIKHIDKSCCLAENIVDDLLTEGVTTLPVAFSDNRRERMIELLDGYYEETGINVVHYFTEEESEMLADYILSDGWIRPPCKVGDTVYIITTKHPCYACNFCTDYCHKSCRIDDKAKQVVKKAQVCSIELGAINKICAEIEETKIATSYKYTCWFEDFGKTVFLTREEAEKALAERKAKANEM